MSRGLKYTHPSESKWEEIVASSENAYFFHTPAWAKIMEETYGHETATRLYEITGNEILVPMMKHKRYGFCTFSSMAGGYGGIFSTSALTPDIIKKVLKDIVGGKSLLLNISLPPFVDLPIREDAFVKEVNSEWNYTHVLPLEQGFEYLWKKRFVGKTRTAVRKAEKSGVKVLEASLLENVRQFYKLYVETSRRWGVSIPSQPLRFYENLYKFGSPYVRLTLAIKDDVAIGGLVNLYYAKNVFCWMNAFLKEYAAFVPVKLLMKESIEQACNESYRLYNFGASGNLEGVRKFKESFGAEKAEVKHYLVQSRLGKLARIALRR